jgi:hypothetical protein
MMKDSTQDNFLQSEPMSIKFVSALLVWIPIINDMNKTCEGKKRVAIRENDLIDGAKYRGGWAFHKRILRSFTLSKAISQTAAWEFKAWAYKSEKVKFVDQRLLSSEISFKVLQVLRVLA